MVALNTRRADAVAWAPPLGEVTTLVATTTGTWPAGTRMVVGDSTDTIATGTVLGAAVVSVDGLTATWALSEAQCAILRAHTRLLVQVPSGAAWEGILAGAIAPEPVWSGARAVQAIGSVLVGPQGPQGISAYAAAVAAGYTGTAEEWAAGLASERLTAMAAADRAEAAANQAQGLVTSAVRASYDPGTDAEVLTLSIPTGMLDPLDPLILLLPVEVS